MQVKCSCGKLLEIPDILAGKKARCPACKNVLSIPAGQAAQTGGSQMVMMECSCGKRLRAPVTAAGNTVRCPACNTELTVPAPDRGQCCPDSTTGKAHGRNGTAGGQT